MKFCKPKNNHHRCHKFKIHFLPYFLSLSFSILEWTWIDGEKLWTENKFHSCSHWIIQRITLCSPFYSSDDIIHDHEFYFLRLAFRQITKISANILRKTLKNMKTMCLCRRLEGNWQSIRGATFDIKNSSRSRLQLSRVTAQQWKHSQHHDEPGKRFTWTPLALCNPKAWESQNIRFVSIIGEHFQSNEQSNIQSTFRRALYGER